MMTLGDDDRTETLLSDADWLEEARTTTSPFCNQGARIVDDLLGRLRQAEADRDAYAAVLRPVFQRAKATPEDAPCWDCGALNEPGNHFRGCIVPGLDALTAEQKERIT